MSEFAAGQHYLRMLAGTIPMIMTVESVNEDVVTMHGGWTFCTKTGMEIDEDLGWGPKYGITGSFLKRNQAGAFITGAECQTYMPKSLAE